MWINVIELLGDDMLHEGKQKGKPRHLLSHGFQTVRCLVMDLVVALVLLTSNDLRHGIYNF